MTHIQNIPHVLEFGITHTSSPNRNSNFVPIGDGNIILKRNSLVMSNLRKLGDYIPFYFGTRMPMLYVIQHGYGVPPTSPENIVYCISSVEQIVNHGLSCIYTNGHAIVGLSKIFTDVEAIDANVDMKAVKSTIWIDEKDLDLKRRKEAEFLILGDLPLTAILGYAVYNASAKEKLVDLGIENDKVVVKPEYYF